MDQTDQIVKDLHYEVKLLLQQHNDDEEILEYLMQKGCNRYYARTIVENVRNDFSHRNKSYKFLFNGIAALLCGILFTTLTRRLPVAGGLYFIFDGLMVYGAVMIARAVILLRR